MKKSFSELREQRMAANEKLGDLYAKAQNRELTDDEKIQEALEEKKLDKFAGRLIMPLIQCFFIIASLIVASAFPRNRTP